MPVSQKSTNESRQDLLLAQYVSSFEQLDEMAKNPDIYPLVRGLAVSDANELGQVAWRPCRVDLRLKLLNDLYSKLPAKFPPLFERFLLTFRWADVSLGSYSLMANPAGDDLDGFFEGISRDRGLWNELMPSGYLRFGKGPDMDYDPVCFDVKSRRRNREMRVVKIDHEEILCNRRIKIVAELAPSFEALVEGTIEVATRASRQQRRLATSWPFL